jgi:hypothetical protein
MHRGRKERGMKVSKETSAKHREADAITPYRLGQVLAERGIWEANESRQWYRYAKGERSPSRPMLNALDRAFPGTSSVYEDGPFFSYLWEALAGDARRAISITEDHWRSAVPVEHTIRIPAARATTATGRCSTLMTRS